MKDKDQAKATLKLSNGTELECPKGSNLRRALAQHFGFLYNSPMAVIHCRGMGTCGTCAVKITGNVSPPTAMEKWRLNFPPHKQSLKKGLRLACQCQVLGDLEITKWDGRWGQGRE